MHVGLEKSVMVIVLISLAYVQLLSWLLKFLAYAFFIRTVFRLATLFILASISGALTVAFLVLRVGRSISLAALVAFLRLFFLDNDLVANCVFGAEAAWFSKVSHMYGFEVLQ